MNAVGSASVCLASSGALNTLKQSQGTVGTADVEWGWQDFVQPEIPISIIRGIKLLRWYTDDWSVWLGLWAAHFDQTTQLGHVCMRADRSVRVPLKLLDADCPRIDNPTVWGLVKTFLEATCSTRGSCCSQAGHSRSSQPCLESEGGIWAEEGQGREQLQRQQKPTDWHLEKSYESTLAFRCWHIRHKSLNLKWDVSTPSRSTERNTFCFATTVETEQWSHWGRWKCNKIWLCVNTR